MCCFTPCIYHYTCRKNASLHRNRFAKTCTGVTAICCHVLIIVLTGFLLTSSIVLNLIWISSLQGLGEHRVVPGVHYACGYADGYDLTVDFLYQPSAKPLRGCGWPVFCFDLSSGPTETSSSYIESKIEMQAARNGTLHFRYDKTQHSLKQEVSYLFGFNNSKQCYAATTSQVTAINHREICITDTIKWPYFLGCRFNTPKLDTSLNIRNCNVTFVDK